MARVHFAGTSREVQMQGKLPVGLYHLLVFHQATLRNSPVTGKRQMTFWLIALMVFYITCIFSSESAEIGIEWHGEVDSTQMTTLVASLVSGRFEILVFKSESLV